MCEAGVKTTLFSLWGLALYCLNCSCPLGPGCVYCLSELQLSFGAWLCTVCLNCSCPWGPGSVYCLNCNCPLGPGSLYCLSCNCPFGPSCVYCLNCSCSSHSRNQFTHTHTHTHNVRSHTRRHIHVHTRMAFSCVKLHYLASIVPLFRFVYMAESESDCKFCRSSLDYQCHYAPAVLFRTSPLTWKCVYCFGTVYQKSVCCDHVWHVKKLIIMTILLMEVCLPEFETRHEAFLKWGTQTHNTCVARTHTHTQHSGVV